MLFFSEIQKMCWDIFSSQSIDKKAQHRFQRGMVIWRATTKHSLLNSFLLGLSQSSHSFTMATINTQSGLSLKCHQVCTQPCGRLFRPWALECGRTTWASQLPTAKFECGNWRNVRKPLFPPNQSQPYSELSAGKMLGNLLSLIAGISLFLNSWLCERNSGFHEVSSTWKGFQNVGLCWSSMMWTS